LDSGGQGQYLKKTTKGKYKNKNAQLIDKCIEKRISWLPIEIRKNKKKWNSKIPEPKILLRYHQNTLKKGGNGY
jgi:hypothetical protein